jgi:DNA end-binding protein Ku
VCRKQEKIEKVPGSLGRESGIYGREAVLIASGARGEIRTPDLLVRSQTLYPTELRAHALPTQDYQTGQKTPSFQFPDRPALHLNRSMARPYWSGQISLSLVSFAVELYPASTSARPFQFHQIDRATGQRIHHQNVVADGDDEDSGSLHIARKGPKSHNGDEQHAVEKSEIVKGYEYEKGKYAIIEPDDLKRLRIPGKDTLEIVQFSSAAELSPSLFEKPYFVVPKKGPQATAFAVVRQGMIDTGMVGLGEIAFAGREHLVALAPPADKKQLGMMLYILRFEDELRDPAEYFGKISAVKQNAAQLELAKQLIKTYTRPLQLDKFTDHYETAVRELVAAKMANKPLPKEQPAKARGKVVDLMSALRQSLATKEAPKASTASKRKLKVVGGKPSKTA